MGPLRLSKRTAVSFLSSGLLMANAGALTHTTPSPLSRGNGSSMCPGTLKRLGKWGLRAPCQAAEKGVRAWDGRGLTPAMITYQSCDQSQVINLSEPWHHHLSNSFYLMMIEIMYAKHQNGAGCRVSVQGIWITTMSAALIITAMSSSWPPPSSYPAQNWLYAEQRHLGNQPSSSIILTWDWRYITFRGRRE